jgi:hypothetical protein
MSFYKFERYFKESIKLRKHSKQNFWIFELLRDFPLYYRCLNNGSSPIINERPWITFAAHRFLHRQLRPDMRVYEFGTGGSTLYFAHHTKEIISVEHDKSWAERVNKALKLSGKNNWQINIIEPHFDQATLHEDPASLNSYISNGDDYRGQSFIKFAKDIDRYPDGYFNIVLIDGRARPSCFRHSVKKVCRYGFLILDNAERRHYIRIHEQMNDPHWARYSFFGPGPYHDCFWQTVIWQRNF